MMKACIQLVPRCSPPVCGVDDYAQRLATGFEAQGVRSQVVPYHAEGDWRQMLRQATVEAGNGVVWLVHYSGYGYAKRGAPLALLLALQRLLRDYPKVRLLTMFHELYAGGTPWTSAFWLSPLQRFVAARLAQLSDAIVTNREASGAWLRSQLSATVPVTVKPVFSNFGEDHAPQPPEARPARLLLFGSGTVRAEDFWAQVQSAMERLQLKELVVVSHPLEVPAELVSRYAVRQTGVLSAEAMADELRAARCGVLEYNPDFLGKSGVFAAYAAFGVVPLLTRGRGRLLDGLDEDHHYLAAGTVEQKADLATVQEELRRWYATHSQAETVRAYLEVWDECRLEFGKHLIR